MISTLSQTNDTDASTQHKEPLDQSAKEHAEFMGHLKHETLTCGVDLNFREEFGTWGLLHQSTQLTELNRTIKKNNKHFKMMTGPVAAPP